MVSRGSWGWKVFLCVLQLVVCFCLFDKSSKSTDFNAKILCSQTRFFSHIENKKKIGKIFLQRRKNNKKKSVLFKKSSSIDPQQTYKQPLIKQFFSLCLLMQPPPPWRDRVHTTNRKAKGEKKKVEEQRQQHPCSLSTASDFTQKSKNEKVTFESQM